MHGLEKESEAFPSCLSCCVMENLLLSEPSLRKLQDHLNRCSLRIVEGCSEASSLRLSFLEHALVAPSSLTRVQCVLLLLFFYLIIIGVGLPRKRKELKLIVTSAHTLKQQPLSSTDFWTEMSRPTKRSHTSKQTDVHHSGE